MSNVCYTVSAKSCPVSAVFFPPPPPSSSLSLPLSLVLFSPLPLLSVLMKTLEREWMNTRGLRTAPCSTPLWNPSRYATSLPPPFCFSLSLTLSVHPQLFSLLTFVRSQLRVATSQCLLKYFSLLSTKNTELRRNFPLQTKGHITF